jgi:hypothetical protein
MTFDVRLATTVVGVLATMGCVGGKTTTTTDSDSGTIGTTTLESLCDGAIPPEDYLVTTGWVEVPPGTACPDAPEAQIQVYGCTFLEWQGVTCAFDEVQLDQVFVDDGYGGRHVDASSVGTTAYGYEVGEPVDLCLYDAVFYLPPDHPTCGRPLLHEGERVLAALRPGESPWGLEREPTVDGLARSEREALHRYWLGCALLEHASVASFAQASLALLRFGAPPELVEAVHRSALDEIDHAKRCFSLASAYAGSASGPGAFGEGGLPPVPATLREFAVALVREGCVGETLAAVDAAARLAGTRDPAVRDTLEVILRDESAHAALAWRTLAWVLRQAPELREELAEVLREERRTWATAAGEGEVIGAGARAHGLVTDRERRAALERAWTAVILPTWEGLDG